MSDPERILVVMPNWFGETLFATPFLQAVHDRYSRAAITVMGVARSHLALAQHPVVRQFITYDERGLHRTLRGKCRILKVLRAEQFDAAFVLRRSLSRTMLLALAGIPKRIGFANLKSGWLLTDRIQAPQALTHKAATYLHLLSPLDAHLPAYDYYPSDSERLQAQELLRASGLLDGRPLVVLHPGANWPHKRWPIDRFAELAQQLAKRQALAIAITGSPEDASLAQAVAARLGQRVVVLIGRTSFRLCAACLEHASLVISSDTGMLHVAAALKRPVVALYGPTSPAMTGPLGDPARTTVIHHSDCCPAVPCFRPHHPNFPGMEAISVEEVLNASLKLLEQNQ